ncbi:hypothetical protein BOTBODRAFT_35886 [Botryobasidium botryosum FD-172 SS1]|uniref:Secreted protein n=1 Tax=Botryobasidium botryosum (strain FD-172 SS1) TaxID=930990 RepID=A0A067MGR1_BOTB1|nr:hypothetical protein BOTBODRAFT_35886 [Botryobasidium botryosum FD-172 SS1]
MILSFLTSQLLAIVHIVLHVVFAKDLLRVHECTIAEATNNLEIRRLPLILPESSPPSIRLKLLSQTAPSSLLCWPSNDQALDPTIFARCII